MSNKTNVVPFSTTPATPLASEQTMSSRDIAEVVESRHDKVKQSIERLAERGLITFTPVGEKPNGGRPSTAYMVNKRDSYVIVAQLSPEFTARLVDRWQQLEQQVQQPAFNLPSNYVEALEALVVAEKQKEEQQLLIEQQSPKAKFYDEWLKSDELTSFRELANIIQVPETKLKAFLILNDALYEQGKKSKPYKRDVNDSKVKVFAGGNFKFTNRGVEWVIRMWDAQNQDSVSGRFFIF